uniref:Uncharacterized protein n=1 Tax=Fagus sylvatica TaxID=28930 RepID=A0A2N9FLG7_FAGSY
MDRRLRTSRSAADRWAPWNRRSASARERPRGAEGGSGWGDSGTSRSAADRWAPWRSAIGECERETKRG